MEGEVRRRVRLFGFRWVVKVGFGELGCYVGRFWVYGKGRGFYFT